MLPRNPKIVALQAPVTTNGAITTPFINCKNASKVIFVCVLKQAVAHATVVSIYQGNAKTGGTEKIIANTVPIWLNADIDSSSDLTAQMDAASLTMAASAKDMVIIFQLDPAALDSGYGYAGIHTTASSQITNFMSVTALVFARGGGVDELDLLT
jgi:hypothetical protein